MLVAGGAILAIWLWNARGHEVVQLDGAALTIERGVGPFRRRRRFDRSRVRDVRVSPTGYNPWRFSPFAWWGMGGGLIAFDYGARTYHFGSGLEEAEAKRVIEELDRRLVPRPF